METLLTVRESPVQRQWASPSHSLFFVFQEKLNEKPRCFTAEEWESLRSQHKIMLFPLNFIKNFLLSPFHGTHHPAIGTPDLLDTIKQHFSKIWAARTNTSRPSCNYIQNCLHQCSTHLPPSFPLTISWTFSDWTRSRDFWCIISSLRWRVLHLLEG